MENAYIFVAGFFSIALIVIAASYGIKTIASKAYESMARQPEASDDIKASMTMPMAFIEGAVMAGILLISVVMFMSITPSST